MYKRASQFLNSMRATTLAGTGFGVKLPSASSGASRSSRYFLEPPTVLEGEAIGDVHPDRNRFLRGVNARLRALTSAGVRRCADQAEKLNELGFRNARGGLWNERLLQLMLVRLQPYRAKMRLAQQTKTKETPPQTQAADLIKVAPQRRSGGGVNRRGVDGKVWLTFPSLTWTSVQTALGHQADAVMAPCQVRQIHEDLRLEFPAHYALPECLVHWMAKQRPVAELTLMLASVPAEGRASMSLHPSIADGLRHCAVREVTVYYERRDDPADGRYQAQQHSVLHRATGSGQNALLSILMDTDGGGSRHHLPPSVLQGYLKAGGWRIEFAWNMISLTTPMR
jgi:hypothetical protein